MEQYITPSLELIYLENIDIITDSDGQPEIGEDEEPAW